MRRTWLAIFVLLFVVPALAFSGGSAEQGLKIGFIGPLTGDYANYGKLMTQAIRIAVDERNAAGGIGGNQVVFVPEDSEGKPDKANAAIEKLASVDKIYGLVGAVFSSSSLAIAPRCQAERIVMISPSSTHKDLTGKGSYIFRDIASDALQGEVLARYVYNEMGIRRVAVLYVKNDYSQGLYEEFERVFQDSGGEIVAVETGLQGDKDFKTQLTKIRGTEPEALFVPNYVAEIAQILEQAEQLGIDAQMLSADGFSNPEIFDLVPDSLSNGVVFSGPPAEDAAAENPKQAAFEAKYEEEYDELPDSFSLNSYDAANLLMDAMQHAYDQASASDKEAFNLDRGIIQDYIAQIRGYQGVSGTITFLDNGDVAKNIGILTAQGGSYQQLGVYTVLDGQLQEVSE
jgi:branched-chain amino acid transport system substrate-binding protein